ncbi:hypothetical protein RUND412_008809 [Rhizina undulata]
MSGIASNAGKSVLKQGAKRDPELYILFAVMSGAFGLAGYYFGTKPTSATSEDTRVNVAHKSQPWNDPNASASDTYKYKYHPDGDSRNAPKEAPSALHTTIVPNVSLPKELHEKYNKYGKDGY